MLILKPDGSYPTVASLRPVTPDREMHTLFPKYRWVRLVATTSTQTPSPTWVLSHQEAATLLDQLVAILDPDEERSIQAPEAKPVAWRVVCADGSNHSFYTGPRLHLSEHAAQRAVNAMDATRVSAGPKHPCGPHRVEPLYVAPS